MTLKRNLKGNYYETIQETFHATKERLYRYAR